MGGASDVKSPVRDGKGGEFSFTLKFEKIKEAVGVAAKEISKQPVKTRFTPPQNLRVLVVDDVKMNQKMLTRRFSQGVFKDLDVADNGEQALEKIDGNDEFDLIIMDENMQETGGVLLGSETTVLIRKREGGDGHRALIIANSGNCTEEDREMGRKSGQDGFWEKPLPSAEQMLQDVARLWAAKGGVGGGEGEKEKKEDELQLPGMC